LRGVKARSGRRRSDGEERERERESESEERDGEGEKVTELGRRKHGEVVREGGGSEIVVLTLDFYPDSRSMKVRA
jgi:hypothetical protein